jgi:hypothetical protein
MRSADRIAASAFGYARARLERLIELIGAFFASRIRSSRSTIDPSMRCALMCTGSSVVGYALPRQLEQLRDLFERGVEVEVHLVDRGEEQVARGSSPERTCLEAVLEDGFEPLIRIRERDHAVAQVPGRDHAEVRRASTPELRPESSEVAIAVSSNVTRLERGEEQAHAGTPTDADDLSSESLPCVSCRPREAVKNNVLKNSIPIEQAFLYHNRCSHPELCASPSTATMGTYTATSTTARACTDAGTLKSERARRDHRASSHVEPAYPMT